jgi:Tfp pilus assembly protein PilO
MSSPNKMIVAMLAVAALAVAFWVLALSPKREEANKLGTQISSLRESLALDNQKVDEALEARKSFAADYGQLVVLGKAVPADDDTASLLVQVNQIATKAGVRFQEIALAGSSSEGAAAAAPAAPVSPEPAGEAAPTAPSTSTVAAPTESVAATMPLGASIGPAGLAVMHYSLKFTGEFAHVADFIQGIDRLVKTSDSDVGVDGRLITVDGFSLGAAQNQTFPQLEANFAVTTYLTPASQGVTGGATPVAPESSTATPAAAITGATP